MFELRKNKWLSQGQPGYNFWLSVQIFLLYVLGIYTEVSFGYRFMVVCWTTASVFLVVPGVQTTKILNTESSLAAAISLVYCIHFQQQFVHLKAYSSLYVNWFIDQYNQVWITLTLQEILRYLMVILAVETLQGIGIM